VNHTKLLLLSLFDVIAEEQLFERPLWMMYYTYIFFYICRCLNGWSCF